MGCIKPPLNVTDPAPRAANRLAFTPGAAAVDGTSSRGSASSHGEFGEAKQALSRAAAEMKAATTVADVDRALAGVEATLQSALARTQDQAQRQSLRDRGRDLDRKADEAKARLSVSQWIPAGSRPPDVGVIFDDEGDAHVVSFKVGATGGSRDGHTLIADGDFSEDAKTFNEKHGHNHYGPDSEDPGSTFAKDRGAYTGPDH